MKAIIFKAKSTIFSVCAVAIALALCLALHYTGAYAVYFNIKEFELLTYFLENQGIALSREKILNSVWNYDYFGDARTIDTHVKKLRSKMGDKGEYIKTVWGMGYKFEVE